MEDKQKYLEQLPVRKIRVRHYGEDKYSEVLVDGDYDGEYLASLPLRLSVHLGYVMVLLPQYTEEILKTGVRRRLAGAKPLYLHQFVLPPKPGYVVTFRNGNKLDCRSANLVYITKRQRAAKMSREFAKDKPQSTKYRGVQRMHSGERYKAMWIGRKYITICAGKYLSSHDTPEEAAMAYDRAARKRWGEYAQLNFPPIPGMNYCRRCYKPVKQPAVYHEGCLA